MSKPPPFTITGLITAMAVIPVITTQTQLSAQEHVDIEVARTFSGQLAWRHDRLDMPGPLEPVSGLWNALGGWIGMDPGFNALAQDEPDQGMYVLSSGASVWLEIIGVDAGLTVWAEDTSASIDASGQRLRIGGRGLHYHAWWHMDEAIGQPGTLWATFKFVDTGSTGYADSPPLTMAFTNAPEPADLPGDADRDGDVDDDDLSLLLSNWGLATDWSHGEFSGIPPVNDDDLSLLLSHWTPAPNSVEIPEPAALWSLGGGALVWRRRKRVL